MLIALTGTPGVGKTSVSNVLQKKGFKIVDLNRVAVDKDFLIGIDEKRSSSIVDIDKLNKYVKDNYLKKDIVFIVGHLSHLLKSVERIIILRCHPNELSKRLSKKRWNKEKIRENIEAEMLDVILCETLEIHLKEYVFEIDTTAISIELVASSILDMVRNKFIPMKKYNVGKIDWSEEILKDF